MNIYLFELKAQLRSFLIWTAGILAILFAFMSGIYPAFYDSLDIVMEALENFPPAFAAAFGMASANLYDFGGFFSFSFLYLSLAGAIMAVAVSVSIFAREKRSRCTDFLLSKPIDRNKVFAAKLLSALTVIGAANIVFIIALIILYTTGNHDPSRLGEFVYSGSGLFFTQLVFLAIGVIFATMARKVRSISGVATAVGFAGFILSALHDILEKEVLRFVAPMEYFDTESILSTGGYETKMVITAAVVILLCLIISFFKFCKSDTRAV